MNIPASALEKADDFQEAVDLMRSGNVTAAAQRVMHLLETQPRDYGVLHLAGTIALAENHHPEALQYFRSAIEVAPDKPNEAMSWNGVGQVMSKLRRYPQAEEAFRRAMLADPASITHLLDFAQSLSSAHKYDLAVDVLRTAINRYPKDPAPYVRLGSVFVGMGRQREALLMYDFALKQDPHYSPAHYNASVALTMLGKLEEAYQACDTALALDPGLAGYYQLANLGKVDERRTALLEQRVQEDSGYPIAARVDAGFALAKEYQRRSEHEQSFGFLHNANRLKRTTMNYTVNSDMERVRRLKSMFTRDFFARFDAGITSTLKPIFILGMPRSGSTLVEQMLAAHPDVQAGGELPHIPVICEEVGEIWGARGAASPGSNDEVIADLTHAAGEYAKLTAHLRRYHDRFTDKLPGNFLLIGMIHLMFPHSTIIHTQREPFDTCLSCYEHLFAAELAYTYDLTELGQVYCLYEEIMEHWHAVLPRDRILDVQYETIVADPEPGLRRILDHCGLSFNPACLDFHEVKRAVTTASATQVRKPIYQSSIGRWRLYRDWLHPLADALGRPMAED